MNHNDVITTQVGGRHRYAVPLAFATENRLAAFYTDVCADLGLGHTLRTLAHFPVVGKRLTRLARRTLPDDIISYSTAFLSLLDMPLLFRPTRSEAERYVREQEVQNRLGTRMISAGFGDAKFLYSMLGEFSPFVVGARQAGLKVLSEIYIALSAHEIVKQERFRFPDWESPVPDFWTLNGTGHPSSVLLSETDLFVCPSPFVQQDLVNRWNITQDHTAVVPYIARSYERPSRETCRKRILFVGTAALRKGIHYLAQAATELRQQDPDFEVRVIGEVSKQVRSHRDSRNLHFMGTMSWREAQQELSAADVLVLPSLAEGSASVTYEALSLGIPQVVTASSGSVISSGVEGFVIPERNAAAVVDAIQLITKDRNRRLSMSDASFEKAKDYSFDKFKARLVGLLDRWSVAQ